MPTEERGTTAVAVVMPRRTGHTRKRVAKVRAMSWDLSPSSATKMTPKARRVLTRTASTVRDGPLRSGRARCDTSTRHACMPWVEGLARLPGQAARPDVGRSCGVGQRVDRDIGGYSPSLPSRVTAELPQVTVTVDSPDVPGPAPAGGWSRAGTVPPTRPPGPATAAGRASRGHRPARARRRTRRLRPCGPPDGGAADRSR